MGEKKRVTFGLAGWDEPGHRSYINSLQVIAALPERTGWRAEQRVPLLMNRE